MKLYEWKTMRSASCSICHELVRLPVAEIPQGGSLRCPWCGQVQPIQHWRMTEPPAATVLDSTGLPIECEATTATNTKAATDSDNESLHQALQSASATTPASTFEPLLPPPHVLAKASEPKQPAATQVNPQEHTTRRSIPASANPSHNIQAEFDSQPPPLENPDRFPVASPQPYQRSNKKQRPVSGVAMNQSRCQAGDSVQILDQDQDDPSFADQQRLRQDAAHPENINRPATLTTAKPQLARQTATNEPPLTVPSTTATHYTVPHSTSTRRFDQGATPPVADNDPGSIQTVPKRDGGVGPAGQLGHVSDQLAPTRRTASGNASPKEFGPMDSLTTDCDIESQDSVMTTPTPDQPRREQPLAEQVMAEQAMAEQQAPSSPSQRHSRRPVETQQSTVNPEDWPQPPNYAAKTEQKSPSAPALAADSQDAVPQQHAPNDTWPVTPESYLQQQPVRPSHVELTPERSLEESLLGESTDSVRRRVPLAMEAPATNTSTWKTPRERNSRNNLLRFVKPLVPTAIATCLVIGILLAAGVNLRDPLGIPDGKSPAMASNPDGIQSGLLGEPSLLGDSKPSASDAEAGAENQPPSGDPTNTSSASQFPANGTEPNAEQPADSMLGNVYAAIQEAKKTVDDGPRNKTGQETGSQTNQQAVQGTARQRAQQRLDKMRNQPKPIDTKVATTNAASDETEATTSKPAIPRKDVLTGNEPAAGTPLAAGNPLASKTDDISTAPPSVDINATTSSPTAELTPEPPMASTPGHSSPLDPEPSPVDQTAYQVADQTTDQAGNRETVPLSPAPAAAPQVAADLLQPMRQDSAVAAISPAPATETNMLRLEQPMPAIERIASVANETTDAATDVAQPLILPQTYRPNDAFLNQLKITQDSLEQLATGATDGQDSLHQNLSVFREVARTSGLASQQDEPALLPVLATIKDDPSLLNAFQPLCWQWIIWQRRDTEGVLLTGALIRHHDHHAVLLADGHAVEVQLDQEQRRLVGQQVIAFAKLQSHDDSSATADLISVVQLQQ